MKKKILFVSHDATRTGAPMVLLHLLRWLKQNTDFEIHILLLAKGELQPEFEKIATTHVWNRDEQPSLVQRVKRRLYPGKLYTNEQSKILAWIGKLGVDLVYLNTVVSTDIIPDIARLVSCPIVCHVHENEYTLSFYYPRALSEETKNAVTHFIAVSESTKQNLVNNAGIPANKISICYEFVPTRGFSNPSVEKTTVRQNLGLTDEFIVGGSGLPIWRKGIDLFLQLAVELRKQDKDHRIKLVWVGAIDHAFQCSYAYEKTRLGIEDDIILTGVKNDPQNYFQVFDIFTLTSREDPFPLVCLEAASLGKPVMCFENSGGMVEFLQNEESLIVPYGDVTAMAARIIQLQQQHEERQRLGAEMKKRVEDYDVEKGARAIEQVIRSYTGSKTQLVPGKVLVN